MTSVFAMANPVPEIDYPEALRARGDVIMGTGRSDYPNQINNVLGFPGIFRGALKKMMLGVALMGLVGTTAAISVAGGGDKPKPSVNYAKSWDAAIEEAKALNVPIVVHSHGFN